jgi:hypothetical protein
LTARPPRGANRLPLRPREGTDTITLTHAGRTVALAARARFWLAADIEALPNRDARKRHICFMALYARDVLNGAMPGPYTDTDADRFARLALSNGRTSPPPCPAPRRR